MLVLSAYEGFMDMVTSLIEFGADVNLTSDVGRTALSMACQRGHFDIAKHLLAYGARVITDTLCHFLTYCALHKLSESAYFILLAAACARIHNF